MIFHLHVHLQMGKHIASFQSQSETWLCKEAAARRPFLFCCQQHTYDIFVTGTNLLGMICINHFVLITGLEFQPMVKKRLDAERVFLISTGSELVVRMLGQIIFI